MGRLNFDVNLYADFNDHDTERGHIPELQQASLMDHVRSCSSWGASLPYYSSFQFGNRSTPTVENSVAATARISGIC